MFFLALISMHHDETTQRCARAARQRWRHSSPSVRRKRVFLRHFMLKIIFLPRQTRDKHRENSKKRDGAFSAGPVLFALLCGLAMRDARCESEEDFRRWLLQLLS
jgi:hypothetical protein